MLPQLLQMQLVVLLFYKKKDVKNIKAPTHELIRAITHI
jgi:hypothetical protein